MALSLSVLYHSFANASCPWVPLLSEVNDGTHSQPALKESSMEADNKQHHCEDMHAWIQDRRARRQKKIRLGRGQTTLLMVCERSRYSPLLSLA